MFFNSKKKSIFSPVGLYFVTKIVNSEIQMFRFCFLYTLTATLYGSLFSPQNKIILKS